MSLKNRERTMTPDDVITHAVFRDIFRPETEQGRGLMTHERLSVMPSGNPYLLSRRRFLEMGARFALAACGWQCFSGVCPATAGSEQMPAARYWAGSIGIHADCRACHSPEEVLSPDDYHRKEPIVKCLLCPKECVLKNGERGRCRARINQNGVLKSLVYGRPAAVHVDPIEKKPFFHFLPGASAFSLGTAGCPLSCRFCQNWEISQARPEDIRSSVYSPGQIVSSALGKRCAVIAFTYNEPTVFIEYLTDIAKACRKQGIRGVLVSCGFMNSRPLDEICDVLDAIKIDLKGFSPDFYRNVCRAELDPVLRSIRSISKKKIHLEIVNLVVPTLNDSPDMMTRLIEWVAGEIGPDVPVHFTRFHPAYQMMHLPTTPVSTLEKAYETAKAKGLHYPYVGNVPSHPGNHTHCPTCGKTVVERTGFFVLSNRIMSGKCPFCGRDIAGVWS
jgi:pyruvate formate lyase activating enzyme